MLKSFIAGLTKTTNMQVDIDQSAVLTTVLGNIALQLAIQIQKYAKREIVNLALNGFSTASLEQLWQYGTVLLIVAECFFFLAFGLGERTDILPLGVYTVISNTTIPVLFDDPDHATHGALVCQFGALLMIFANPSSLSLASATDFSSTTTRSYIVLQILLSIVLVAIRAYKPQSCSLKLISNCGLSALMGSYVAVIVELVAYEDYESPLLLAMMPILLLLDGVLLRESVHLFPVLQVVPHHFVLFTVFTFLNKALVLQQLDHLTPAAQWLLVASHLLLVVGVWMSAKPHLDIPADIQRTGLINELQQRVLTSQESDQDLLCSGYGYKILCKEYCHMMSS